MVNRCIGVREDTGEKCQRSASRDSDFCFMHQSQEGNQKVQHLDDDVYYCPHDGKKLLYDVKRDYHRCKKCHGSLFSGKMISSDYARKISQSSQVQHEEKCCSCLEGDGLSIHVIETTYIGGSRTLFGDIVSLAAGRIHTVVRVWLCNSCGSVWVEGKLIQKARIQIRGTEYLEWLLSDGFNVNLGNLDPILDDLVASAASDGNLNWFEQQEKWREIRLGKAEKGREKVESQRLKLCNHVDDSGKECNISKSQRSNHDRDFCWKHQPK